MRKGNIYLRMGSCFISMKKNTSVSKKFPERRNRVFALLATGKNTRLVDKPCLTWRPFFPQKTPSAM